MEGDATSSSLRGGAHESGSAATGAITWSGNGSSAFRAPLPGLFIGPFPLSAYPAVVQGHALRPDKLISAGSLLYPSPRGSEPCMNALLAPSVSPLAQAAATALKGWPADHSAPQYTEPTAITMPTSPATGGGGEWTTVSVSVPALMGHVRERLLTNSWHTAMQVRERREGCERED